MLPEQNKEKCFSSSENWGFSLVPHHCGCPAQPVLQSSWKQIVPRVDRGPKHFWPSEWIHDVLVITDHLVFHLVTGYCAVSKGYFVVLHFALIQVEESLLSLWTNFIFRPSGWMHLPLAMCTFEHEAVQNHTDLQLPLVCLIEMGGNMKLSDH